MHMKRIINGSAAEVHLCSDCARSLGYGEAFSGFGLGLGNIFGELLSKDSKSNTGLVCPGCGKTFDEVLSDGKMGCAECYGVYYEKLQENPCYDAYTCYGFLHVRLCCSR